MSSRCWGGALRDDPNNGCEGDYRSTLNKIADNFGYVFSVEDAYRLLADIGMKTTTKFPCFKADKSYGNIGKLVPERIRTIVIAKKLPCFEFSWHLAICSLFFSKRKGAETTRCQWLWTFRFSLCGRFMPWIRSNQSKLRSSKDSRAFNTSAALKAGQVLLFQQPHGVFPITYILRR